MGVPTVDLGPMTAEDFFAFADTRPDGERWELIEGEPILNPAPSYPHQRIVMNLLLYVGGRQPRKAASWEVLPGLGVRVSGHAIPVPDILIRPAHAPHDLKGRYCDDMIVAFEVLSPSTEKRDLHWKRIAYTNLPSLTHYVVIAQDAIDVVVFARETGFAEQRTKSLSGSVQLRDLGVSIPLAEIYDGTDLV